MQISATLVKGKARVQFGANKVRSPAPDLVGLWEPHTVRAARRPQRQPVGLVYLRGAEQGLGLRAA